MGRFSKFPTLYDQCKTLSAAKLRKWEYIKPGFMVSGVVSWSKNGQQTGCIEVSVHYSDALPVAIFRYKLNDEPRLQRVSLVARPSNLGRGVVWFFVCPKTGLLCRKLFLLGGYFVHRSAANFAIYDKQTLSKSDRVKVRLLEWYHAADNAEMQVYAKHFKRTYRGKPTKRFLRLSAQYMRGQGIDVERLYI
jgi:hypothetical protein